eukprot:191607_1
MEDQKLSDIYEPDIPNVVLIDRNHTISYYVSLCSTILRKNGYCFVTGAGNNCDIAVSLVAVLEKRKLGKVTSIRTGMDIAIQFTCTYQSRWQQPLPMMTFRLRQGEFSKYISGYRQNKMIQIFEKHDSFVTGYLSIEKIKSFSFEELFMANQKQRENANRFVSQLQKQEQKRMNLPDFIKYSSCLIHPLLKEQKFKSALWRGFNI